MGYTFGLLGVVLAAPLSAIARDVFIYGYRRLEGVPAKEAVKDLAAAPKNIPHKEKPADSTTGS
jgi:hypothetical protein